jgi:hypothetical protein
MVAPVATGVVDLREDQHMELTLLPYFSAHLVAHLERLILEELVREKFVLVSTGRSHTMGQLGQMVEMVQEVEVRVAVDQAGQFILIPVRLQVQQEPFLQRVEPEEMDHHKMAVAVAVEDLRLFIRQIPRRIFHR